ncbi:iron ABC transporter permease [Oceanobacillus iheyensis HTE831]|uniref:Iron ABC transporter permease n=1 Tax=Oceanobacillus iheyensis (strain DSM 14371 / CIP 107618 / JCM 11309 / KCTC 3954 / HTE831) TaxID=221109 RepID=Q8ETK1_OCEIH|nr:iron-siderophore ABC transporter substrate-binding protein [Oceanobacillus iheyensis]BAC12215.1 iron ABC transporter permease [Oceanobacillus iheyensis HTE831]
MFKKKSFLLVLMFTIIATLVLAGCSVSSSTEDESEEESNDSAETEGQYPITIEHALGETVIESKPERIATIQWGNHDDALALGVVPVGFSSANYGVQDNSGMLPWTAEKVQELGEENPNLFQDTDGLDFEAIADSNPDVILAAYSGITQEDYDTLTQIAPVVAYPSAPWLTTWREQLEMNSTAMGMKEEGEQLLADVESQIEEKVSEYPELEGKTAAFLSVNAEDLSSFFVYTPADPRGGFLSELGMDYPESITNEIPDSDSFYIEPSAENADMLNDADILVTYGNDNTLEALQADPIFGKVPAIERGSVVIIGDNTPLAAAGTPSALSIQYTIDEYLTLLSEAANKVE